MKRITTVCLLLVLCAVSAKAQPSEDFSKQMDAYLAEDANVAKIGSALERYFQAKQKEAQQQAQMREEELIDEQFKNPKQIAIGDSPVKGNPNAKVTIVEFSDFQCPYCKRGMETMDDVLKEYPNDVKLVFKNLPLGFHEQAKPAALAALAAGEQGKFWEMHDRLFANQRELGDDLYIRLAKELDLNLDKFKSDMKSEKLMKQVEDDAALGAKLGVQGTPGFFVNGVQVRGARPLPYFKQLVDRWLEKN